MQFQYTATNTEGKQLKGVINSNTVEEARAQLNQLGFSILEITETQAVPTEKSTLQKYEFEAFDKTGKQVKGTIPAKTPLLGYKRLADEYHFTITYLAPINATPEEKQAMRLTGLQELKNQYDLDQNQKPSAEVPASEDPKLLAEKELLLKDVDKMLQQIRELLTRFETKISPEKRAEIEGMIDKLLRIKSSNNLEYIRHTSKELLQKIQEDEIFLTESEHDNERQTILQASQKMLMDISKKTAATIDMSTKITETLNKWEEKLQQSNFAFLAHPFTAVKKWLTVTPEIQRLKTQLRALRTQRWTAIKIAFKTPKSTRSAAWQNVKEILAQEKELKQQLKEETHKRDDSNLVIKREKDVYFLEELSTFSGWLLFFYLMYYFIGHYVTTQGLELQPILGIPFDMSNSVLFKYLLGIVFLSHAALSVKLNFFLRNKAATLILSTSTFILSLLLIFNV
jgi:hypothetical protein